MGQKFTHSPRCLLAAVLALGACGGAPADAENGLESESLGQVASWVALGGNLGAQPDALVTRISLAADPRLEPVLAFSTIDQTTAAEQTQAVKWTDSGWVALGPPRAALGPSIAIASGSVNPKRAYLCTGSGGPLVQRWNGASWASVGGDISEETGYKSSRYQVASCGGLVLDRSGSPLVVWSADVGAKANVVYAARWDSQQQRWEGLGPGNIGGRATDVYMDIDAQDRVYVAAYTPGGSYGGGATTRVWRWNGSSWTQLGDDMPGTASPVIGVYGSAAYLALHDNASGELRVLRWRDGAWVGLPTPGLGDLPALDFTQSGKPVIAYVAAGPPVTLLVKYLAADRWHSVGSSVADATDKLVGGVELSLDARGRPNLAWSEQDAAGSNAGVLVRRYSASLP